MENPSLTLQQVFRLAELPHEKAARISSDLPCSRISHVTSDSRSVQPGSLFFAIPGTQVDGHRFLAEAAAANAACAIVQKPDNSVLLPQISVECSATAYAKVCMGLYAGSSHSVQTAGVTGTNGKTTTTWMLHSILKAAGRKAGLIGTILHNDGLSDQPSKMTTPDARDLGLLFGRMAQNGSTHCAMEISSHALDQKRAAGIPLSAAAITNITQDHFDYHAGFSSYAKAKASIANLLDSGAPLLLNIDDPGCQAILESLSSSVTVLTYGIQNPDSDRTASIQRMTHRSTMVQMKLAQGDRTVRLKLVGQHNVSNALAAACLAEQMGIGLDAIVEGLQILQSVPGRLQRIDQGQPFQLYIDYAHTPDGLRHCLETVRSFTPGRTICVFGAGGDRDASKRPLMGQAAANADHCIVTSDNPRSECPEKIIREVCAGFKMTSQCDRIADRKAAIAAAIEMAEIGDTLIIVGKGHETSQEINGQFNPFNDVDVAKDALNDLDPPDGSNSNFARSA